MDACAIGIDVGTTNVKVVLVGIDGTIHASANRAIPAAVDGDIAELDAEAQWRAVGEAVRACTDAAPQAAAAVVALGVDSQYSSIVPVDAGGRPTAPMRLWQDLRGTAPSFEILSRHDDAFLGFIDRHGIPPVGGGLSLGHILDLQTNHPDVHAVTAAYLEPMDAINARFTGTIAANQATMFMSQLVDNRSLGQTTYDDVLLGWSGVDASRLPPLRPLDEPVGTVVPEVANALGLPAGVTVAAGINDTHAGSISTDADRAGGAGLCIGTTSVLIDTIGAKAVDLDHEILSCPGPFDDAYLVMAENGLGGRSVEHVLSAILDTGGFDALDDLLARVPSGSGGVIFLPWLRGSMAPSNEGKARGGWINVGLDTDRDDMTRAVCEGVAHNLGWLLPYVEALSGDPVGDLLFIGGAARSAGWSQVIADVLGRPVGVPSQPHLANARSSALLALHRIGLVDRPGLADLVAPERTFAPDPDAHAVHGRIQPQFEAAFDALRPITVALNS